MASLGLKESLYVYLVSLFASCDVNLYISAWAKSLQSYINFCFLFSRAYQELMAVKGSLECLELK